MERGFEPGYHALIFGLTKAPQYNWESCVILDPIDAKGRIGVKIVGGKWDGKDLSIPDTCLSVIRDEVPIAVLGRLAVAFGKPIVRQALQTVAYGQIPNVLEEHVGSMLLPVRSSLVVFGCNRGPDSGCTSSKAISFSSQGCWSCLGNVPINAAATTAARVSSYEAIFIGAATGAVTKFNSIMRIWSPVAKMNISRQGCVCLQLDGKIFAALGAKRAQEHARAERRLPFRGGFPAGLDEACSPEQLDLSTGKWSLIAFNRHERVSDFCNRQKLSTLEGSSIGSMKVSGTESVIIAGGYIIGETDACFDVFALQLGAEGIELKTLPDMSTPRSQAACHMWKGLMIVAGGWGGHPLSTVEAFDGHRWTNKSAMHVTRVGGSLAEVNGRLFAIGGNPDTCMVERLNDNTGAWEEVPMMKLSSGIGGCVAFGLPCKDQGTTRATKFDHVPKRLIVKGNRFTYDGEYILEATTFDGWPVWKWTSGHRYIHYDASSQQWRLGSFGHLSPPFRESSKNTYVGICGPNTGSNEKGSRRPVKSRKGWDHGFHFRAGSTAASPHLISPSDWEEWGPEEFVVGFQKPWGWYPTDQVAIVNGDVTVAPETLVIDADGWKDQDEELFIDGMYSLQPTMHDGRHTWKQDESYSPSQIESLRALAEEKKESCIPSWVQHALSGKTYHIFYNQKSASWLIGDRCRAICRAKTDIAWPDLIPQKWWQACVKGDHPNSPELSPEESMRVWMNGDQLGTVAGRHVRTWKFSEYGGVRIMRSGSLEAQALEQKVQDAIVSEEQSVSGGSHSGSAVVDEGITHPDPPARYSSVEVQSQADANWASSVEALISGQSTSSALLVEDPSPQPHNEADSGAVGPVEKVHLLRFGSGDGQMFRNAILKGPQFRPCRDALLNAGLSCLHPSEAIILVRPDQFQDVSHSLTGHEVHPFHVIITESLEYLLSEILDSMPCRRRPREKPRLRKELVLHTDEDEGTEGESAAPQEGHDGDDDGEYESAEEELDIVVKRSFLCVAPQLKDPQTVVQSTTEAVRSRGSASQGSGDTHEIVGYYTHFRGVNPRRIV